MTKEKVLTPLMRQYFDIKRQFPDTLVFFQVGDFYELFFEDAQKASQFLGITLTSRGTDMNGNAIPLAGVPLHVVEHYLTKLVKGGFKVAICDQLEVAKPGKVVERGITQVLTPGTLTDSRLLDEKSASYLAALFPTQERLSVFFVEILTGQLYISHIKDSSEQLLQSELNRFIPDEILLPNSKQGIAYADLMRRWGCAVSVESASMQLVLEESTAWFSAIQPAASIELATDSLRFGCALLYNYLKRNNERALTHIRSISVASSEDYLLIDPSTQRNLELIKNTYDGSSAHTLFHTMDHAVTPMGSRTLKKWLLRPLINRTHIEQRLSLVEFFCQQMLLKDQLREEFKKIGDLERIVGRIALKRASAHDYVRLYKAIEYIPEIKAVLREYSHHASIASLTEKIGDFSQLYHTLTESLNDDAGKDWVIKSGCNVDLDRLRELLERGVQSVLELEQKEQAATGINSLKVRFNGAHGYGIEVTKPNIHLVPLHYVRIQTLVNRERYTTQELKNLEYDLSHAQTNVDEIERELFEGLKEHVESYLGQLKKLTYTLSSLDAILSLSHVAYTNGYVRPLFNDKREFDIVDGFHPVVYARLGHEFIPNSLRLTDEESLLIITGPNMGGKSTFLRQAALISLMAQMGSFVPAKSAYVPIVDRIFTRIGASDYVAEGKSTFLVEMEETSLICHQATAQSLVILDEVGRGTSTIDGLAIAQAVIEYIYTTVKARCLFATHYHELTDLTQSYAGIAAYYAASVKREDGIVLLHKILKGVAQASFGLEVAKLAHLPEPLIQRAYEIFNQLYAMEKSAPVASHSSTSHTEYLDLFARNQELELLLTQKEAHKTDTFLAAELVELDFDNLTPRQALDILWRLKQSITH